MLELARAFQLIPRAIAREIYALELDSPRTRSAVKSIISVVLAVTLATWLELDDLVWAAFSGYMVMRPDFRTSVSRGLMRCVGTCTGAAAGFFLSRWTADDPVALIACLFAFCWIGTLQTLRSRFGYAWLFFGLTGVLVTTQSLADPSDLLHFAATRTAEICVGTGACLIVSALFDSSASRGSLVNAGNNEHSPQTCKLLDESWLSEHWPLIIHATRAALALSLQPLIWRIFELTDFSQVAITSFLVMIVPGKDAARGDTKSVYDRMIHRSMGCLGGSVVGILCLSFVGDDLTTSLMALAVGIWIGHQIEGGQAGISYIGTQFVLGFLTTYIQGPSPATSILPGLERLLGILIACAGMYVMLGLWPSVPIRRQRPLK